MRQGLYIENGVLQLPVDTTSGPGNFYLKPNGIFYITQDNRAVVCPTVDFKMTVALNMLRNRDHYCSFMGLSILPSGRNLPM